MNVLPFALSTLLALVGAILPQEESVGDLPVSGYFESQLVNDIQKGFYHCLDAMSQSEEFLLGRLEYDVFPSVVKVADIQDFLAGSTSLLTDFGAAKEAYFLDHPAPFGVDADALSLSVGTKGDTYAVSIGTGRRDTYLVEGYSMNETEVGSASSALASAIGDIVAEAADKSDYEKAKLAAERVAEKTKYSFAENDPEKAPYVRSPYGALVLGEAVCEGYAKAYKAVLDEMGVPCVLVNGYLLSDEGSYEPHLWTDVEIDGAWYMVDPTLCDSLGLERAFLVPLDEASVDHKEDSVVGASSFRFSYPTLSTNPYGQKSLDVQVSYEGTGSEKIFRADLSFEGKGALALAEEDKHLAVSYSTQTSTKENIIWLPYVSIPASIKANQGDVTDNGDSVTFRDWGSVPFLRFALISEPPTGANEISYADDLPFSSFIARSAIIENEANEGDVARPFANSVTPSNTKKLDILSRYTMEFTYDEPLEVENKEQGIGIEVTSTHGLSSSDYLLTDLRFDEESNTLRFDFRPCDSFLADGEIYSFLPTNLVGKESGLAPHPVTYSFAYASVVCNKILPEGRLYMDVLAHPSLIDEQDLSLTNWELDGKSVPDSFVSQLALVATSIGKNDAATMIDATGIAPFSSSTYELSLHLCGLPQGIPEGSYMKVSFGFPEGFDPSMEGTTFKLFHFKRDVNGDIDPASAEEIPCLITSKGIIAEIASFSPFLLMETRKGEETGKALYTRVSSGEGSVKEKESGRNLAVILDGKEATISLSPKEGYVTSYALLNGDFLETSGTEVSLPSESLEENNVLEVGFVSEAKLGREKAQGIQNIEGTFLSSHNGIERIDRKTMILVWTLVPILGLVAAIAAIVFLVEFRKRKNLSDKKRKGNKH
ncbi:MAG: transglutaminase domain-containing protein [Bacillales bacterium]|nr:transglutaminase domain-containing protein [Bacillales bacterium]MDY5920508.1 transglutaminase domain-containing protein [Candidatus Enteromonas sp.]